MTARAVLVVGAVLCLLLSGCGQPGADQTPVVPDERTEPAEPGDATSSSASTPTASASTPTVADDDPSDGSTGDEATEQPTATAASDPAEDDTEVSASVLPGQFSAIVGGIGDGESCPDDDDPTPYVGRPPWLDQTAEAGSTVLLCLGGFDPTAPVDLVVASPGGEHVVQVLPADDDPGPPVGIDLRTAGSPVTSTSFGSVDWRNVHWWLAPGSPLGTWTLTASDGSETATGAVDVSVGARPRFVAVDVVGTVRVFHASGFPSGPTVVGLYRPTTPRADLDPEDEVEVVFVEEVEPLVADDTGAGVLELDLAGREPGEWCVTTAATPGICRWATVG